MKGFIWDFQNEISTSTITPPYEHYERFGGALKKNFYWGKDAILGEKTNVSFFGSIIEPCIALSSVGKARCPQRLRRSPGKISTKWSKVDVEKYLFGQKYSRFYHIKKVIPSSISSVFLFRDDCTQLATDIYPNSGR